MRGRLAYAVDPVDGVAGTHNTPPLLWILRGKPTYTASGFEFRGPASESFPGFPVESEQVTLGIAQANR